MRVGTDDRSAPHHLNLEVGVAIVPSAALRTGLTGAIVLVLGDRRVGRQRLQPLLVVRVETALIVVYQKNTIAGQSLGCL
jgi:hypothetical protein